METDLIPREGFELKTVKISNFLRKPTPANVIHNIKTAAGIAASLRQADEIIKEFSPNVVIGTGGYACYPVLRQAAMRGVPTAIHESNAIPGLTTKLVEKKAERIMVSFEDSRSAYKRPEKVVVTGTPVREEFIYLTREEAREKLKLDKRPLVVSYWGSLGAREMNKKIAEFILLESKDKAFNHVHATGGFGWQWMPKFVKGLGVDLSKCPGIEMREYIYNMPLYMAAADLLICRAGASTLSELAAASKPSIIVPSPNVSGNHQEKNARIFEKRGAARVILERGCDGRSLYRAVKALLANPQKLSEMKAASAELAVYDSAERIYNTMIDIAKIRP